ncbi:Ubiquitin-conjugating enzyme/RWD-like protein [Amanita muscaria]
MPPLVASATSLKRIHREIADLKKEDLGKLTLSPSTDNLFVWRGTIPGPEGSVYEGGEFEIEIALAQDYPFTAPKIMFKTRIYHMNISQQGSICIDILKNNWSPALSLFKVMLSLSSLLTDPNPKDPLVPSIATQYMRNRRLHDSTAREWTEKHARPKPAPIPPPPVAMPPIQSTIPSSFVTGVTSSRTRSKRPAPDAAAAGRTSNNTSGSRSQRQSARVASASVIELASDSEEQGAIGNSRSESRALGKRKRNVVDGSEQSAEHEDQTRTKRRPPTGTASSSSSSSNDHDVIVIDDD